MNKCKVSVVIPLYNAEKYICENIDSLLNQSFEDFEIIIVNDGSTDNAYNLLLNKYKKQINQSKIKLINTFNFGAPSARNIGIKNANGDYIAFLDADDFYNPDALENMYNLVEKENADILISNVKIIGENRNIEMNEWSKMANNKYSKFLTLAYPIGKIYRKKIIDENHIVWDNVRVCQDANFYLKYILFTDKIVYTDKCFGNYRIVDNGISKTQSENILDIVKALNKVEQYYKEKCKNENLTTEITLIKFFYYKMGVGNVLCYKDTDMRNYILKRFKSKLKELKINNLKYDEETLKNIKKEYKKTLIKLLFTPLYLIYIRIKKVFYKEKRGSNV